ncbi:hypothetical protein HN011_005061 [Eciton burchellii]|nr:hypothetical protein HN011_005061 [Eciton burchellii]
MFPPCPWISPLLLARDYSLRSFEIQVDLLAIFSHVEQKSFDISPRYKREEDPSDYENYQIKRIHSIVPDRMPHRDRFSQAEWRNCYKWGRLCSIREIRDVAGWTRIRRRIWKEHVNGMDDSRLAKIARNRKPNTSNGHLPRRRCES